MSCRVIDETAIMLAQTSQVFTVSNMIAEKYLYIFILQDVAQSIDVLTWRRFDYSLRRIARPKG